MQDRHRRIVEIFLLRTAGPYIWVTSGRIHVEQMMSAPTRIADQRADILDGQLRANRDITPANQKGRAGAALKQRSSRANQTSSACL